MKNIFLLLALISSLLSVAQKKALVGGTLIDGFGNVPIYDSVILIEDETIVEVGTIGSIEISNDYEIISTEGMSVLPGLWDMHVHLMINGHSDYDYWDVTYLKVNVFKYNTIRTCEKGEDVFNEFLFIIV